MNIAQLIAELTTLGREHPEVLQWEIDLEDEYYRTWPLTSVDLVPDSAMEGNGTIVLTGYMKAKPAKGKRVA